MLLFIKKLKDLIQEHSLFFLYLPILAFPICCILELCISFHLFENYMIQLGLGLYFILIIPLYPMIIFPGIKENIHSNYIANKIPILGIANLSLYVFYAILNRFITNYFQWLDLFLFSITTFIFCLIVTIIFSITQEYKDSEEEHFHPIELIKRLCVRKKKLLSQFKLIPKNYFLFIVLLVLIGIFTIQRFPGLFGDDPWYHASITKEILHENNYNSIDDNYYSLIGLYSLGAYFNLFSNLDVLQIARIFPIITFVLGGFIGYSLTYFILKNAQLSIVGGIIFIITPLDNGLTLGQYWPTAIASTIGIGCFLISLMISFNIWNNLVAKIILYISIFVLFYIHDFTAILLVIGYFFVFLVQRIRNTQTNFSVLVIIIFSVISSLLSRLLSGMSFLSENFSQVFIFPPLLWILIIPGAFILVFFSVKLYKKPYSISGNFWEELISLKSKRSKLFTKKIQIFFLFLSLGIPILLFFVFPALFTYTQTYPLEIGLNIFFAGLMTFFLLSGMISIQKKNNRTDTYFYFILFLFFAIGGFFIIDILFIHYFWWFRIVINASGVISVGFCVYFYIYFKINKKSINKKYLSFILISLALFVNFSAYQIGNYWYKTDIDVHTGKIFSDYVTSDNSVIITGFRWNYLIDFYSEFQIETRWELSYLLKSENLTSSAGINQLEYILNSDSVYLLLDHQQSTLGILGRENVLYGIMNESDFQNYYNIDYINKIISANTLDLTKYNYVYWIIN